MMDERTLNRSLQELSDEYSAINDIIKRFIVGNEALVQLITIGMLSQGHVLIEGVPGTAKTSIVKIIAQIMGCRFNRIQCAVDTQPADIVGIRVWRPELGEFELKKGPIYSNVLLIDEINRLSPKSQSAFIEAMSEKQATIDGITIPIEDPFFAIATQNPYEQEGTFPLIEAQKDRFMFSFNAFYLNSDRELELIQREIEGNLKWEIYIASVESQLNTEKISSYNKIIERIHISKEVMGYIRDLIIATRKHSDLHLGASSRGSIALIRGARAIAALEMRTFVIPDDVKKIIVPALQHRMVINREAEISGVTTKQVIEEILTSVEVP